MVLFPAEKKTSVQVAARNDSHGSFNWLPCNYKGNPLHTDDSKKTTTLHTNSSKIRPVDPVFLIRSILKTLQYAQSQVIRYLHTSVNYQKAKENFS